MVLDPEAVQRMLVEIARSQREAREAPGRDPDAIYRVGEKVQALVDLLNQDRSSHGTGDVLAQLVVQRLETYQIRVTFSERERTYVYDLAAFRDYVGLAPRGRHAAVARFKLIARRVAETVGTDPTQLAGASLPGLRRAVAEDDQFLRDYPGDAKEREVRFFLAVDYYRLALADPAPDSAGRYRRLAGDTLRRVMTESPGTVEARAAEALLDRLDHPGGN